jgi:aspartate aminotransferase
MPIANYLKKSLSGSSLIRKMFEEGTQLKTKYGADKVYDFSLGNPDLEPPPAFHKVLVELATEDAKGSHGYMSNQGYPETRDAMAREVSADQNITITGSHVVMTVGAGCALSCVCKAILNPGDEIVVPKPYFMEYNNYAGCHGGKVVPVPTKADFSLDLDAIAGALNDKTAGVLINSPNNPTGRVYPESALIALAKILTEHGKKTGRFPYLITDEPYRRIVYDGKKVPPVLCHYPESIVCTSYSKSLSLPGERIGYAAVNPAAQDSADVVAAITFSLRVLGFVNAPALMQRCVAQLVGQSCDVSIYARRRALFKKVMDDAGLRYCEPEGAFYLFVQAPLKDGKLGDDFAFSDHLKKYNILGVPGASFGAPGWLRFAYCVDESVIRNSAAAFKQAVQEWKEK